MVIVTRENAPFLSGFEDLVGQRLAVAEEATLANVLRERRPAVADGKVEAAVSTEIWSLLAIPSAHRTGEGRYGS